MDQEIDVTGYEAEQYKRLKTGIVAMLSQSGDAELRHAHDGTLAYLSEQGWQIEYLSYQTLGAATLPNKLTLQNAELKLRLVIDDWQVPAP